MSLAVAHVCLCAFVPLSRVPVPTRSQLILMAEEPTKLKVQLIGQSGVAMSPQTQPAEEQELYQSVPAPGSPLAQPPPPTFMQRARGPFTGLTLLATAAVASWQSNRLYKQRQAGLLEEFATYMVYNLGDVPEMKATLKSFRSQLGPGPFKGRMFTAFVQELCTERPLSVEAVEMLRETVGLFQLSQAAVGELYATAAGELGDQPSVLGKLVFLAERATPEAASAADLRSRFPNWSTDTVGILQDGMLAQLYKDMCKGLPADSPPPKGTDVLKISPAEAARLMKETHEEIAQAAAEELEAQQAKAEREKLEAAMKYAEDLKAQGPSSGGDDASGASRAAGTHEYECQSVVNGAKCGYTLFPAAGRETKFYGDDFKCPQCGCGKADFIEVLD